MAASNGSRIHSVADAHYITIGDARRMAQTEAHAAAKAAGDQLARVFQHVLEHELASRDHQASIVAARLAQLEARTLRVRWLRLRRSLLNRCTRQLARRRGLECAAMFGGPFDGRLLVRSRLVLSYEPEKGAAAAYAVDGHRYVETAHVTNDGFPLFAFSPLSPQASPQASPVTPAPAIAT